MFSLREWLPQAMRKALKARLKRLRAWVVTTFRSYTPADLLTALRELGIAPGDTVMLHCAFSGEHGFRGTARDLINAFIQAVGPNGHLLMVSLPYRNAALDWLESGRRFDVMKTPSMMGLVSEVFRRREGVLRSLHPTHPVLAFGPRAAQFVDAHPNCLYPCGPGSPFDELQRADGMAVFFNVPIDTFTFFHHLEHRVGPSLPFSLYTSKVFDAPVVDRCGSERIVHTHAFAREAIRRRRPEHLYEALRRRGSVAEVRVGASTLLALRVREAIQCTVEMQSRGEYFYDLEPANRPAA